MSETRCPYCKGEIAPGSELMFKLTTRQFRVYNAVINSGPEGISVEELIKECLPGKSKTTIRTCVKAVNDRIGPLVIRSRGGRYHLGRAHSEGENEGDG